MNSSPAPPEGQAPPGGAAGAFQEISRGSIDSLISIRRQKSVDRVGSPELAPFGLLEPPLSGCNSPETHAAAPLLWPAAGSGGRPYSLDDPAEGPAARELREEARRTSADGRCARARKFLQKLLAFTGPGWLMSIAYVDPGNLEADLQCGAQFGYMLLWALLGATFMGLCMQMIAARLGLATQEFEVGIDIRTGLDLGVQWDSVTTEYLKYLRTVQQWNGFGAKDYEDQEPKVPNVLRVNAVTPDGLVQQWNETHPKFAVKPGARIVEVNGHDDVLRMLGELDQQKELKLLVSIQRHLAEHCREQYPPVMRVLLWCMTELAIIGSDIQEVVGCSIGLFILFGTPLATGVVVTAASAFGFLYLERLGPRPLELFFGALIALLAATMGGLFVKISPDHGAILEGFLVPNMPSSAVQQVVGMVGCVIMPHNLFLHSALVQSRVVEPGAEAEAVFLFTIESAIAIVTSLLINAAVVAVFAKGFFGKGDTHDIGMANAGNYLGHKYGSTLQVIWGLGLVASGQSSTMTGAYAGQWVMQGYLELKVKPWKRALVTRGMALVPTLGVAIIFGNRHDALDQLNQYLNCLQSLVLPFALVPLLTFAGSVHIMGGLRLSWVSLSLGWAAAAAIMGTNVYLLVEQFSSDGSVSAGLGLCLALYLGLMVVVAWVGRLSVSKLDWVR